MDLAVFHALNLWLVGETRPFWFLFAHPWAPLGLSAAIVAYALTARSWRLLVVAALAVAIADPLSSAVIKPMIGRERPCAVLAGAHTIRPAARGGCGDDPSMPSGHAANTAALAAALASPPLAAVALTVGVSRVVLGQHYPSDVLAGWAMGAMVGLGVRTLFGRAIGWT